MRSINLNRITTFMKNATDYQDETFIYKPDLHALFG